MIDLVMNSFELTAESAGDITDAVYTRYFADCPESEELMQHLDQGVRGKMIQEVMPLIMVDDYADEQDYLNFEVKFHRTSYHVEAHMYAKLLNALKATVQSSLKDDWTNQFEQAWSARINKLNSEIKYRYDTVA